MDSETNSADLRENRGMERVAKIALKINKYLLPIPIIPFVLMSTTEVVALSSAGLQRTFPATMLVLSIMAYPIVYVFSMVLAKKFYEQKSYQKSVITGLSPVVLLILAAAAQLMMPVR
jgi:uncharacterized membrane protein